MSSVTAAQQTPPDPDRTGFVDKTMNNNQRAFILWMVSEATALGSHTGSKPRCVKCRLKLCTHFASVAGAQEAKRKRQGKANERMAVAEPRQAVPALVDRGWLDWCNLRG